MKEQEIEKLADEYHAKHCLENKLPTDYYNWDSNKWIKQWWIDGYKAALSNPDYILKQNQMKQYIVIEADINDGDYVTEKTKVTDEEIIKIKEILAKMPRKQNYKGEQLPEIRYETREIGNDDKENSDYQHITYEEKQFLSNFLPSGNYNYSGIHTIKNVEIVQELEKIL